MEQHGLMSTKKLKGKLPEEALYAIKAHNERTGVKHGKHARLDA